MEKFISISNTSDFGRAYHRGRSYGNKLLVMYIFERGQGSEGRIGISVSKKVGNSVVRHRIKRQIRECFRTRMKMWKDGFDIVVVARQAIKNQEFTSICSALERTGRQLKVFSSEGEVYEEGLH